MKKVVCLQNIYFEGRYISAGVEVGLPDEVASNWVKRGIAKFVGEETPVNPPALNTEPPVVNAEVPPVENPEANADLPPEVTPEGTGVVKFENDETPVSPNENSTTTTATDPAETPVADDDRPKRGRPPKKHGGKRR